LPGDQRFKDWLSLMTMPAIFFAVFASVSSVRETKVLVVLMCLSILQLDRSFWNSVSGRDFSSYSEELRQELSAGGSMGYAGVNGLAAFEAQAATFLLAMAAFEKRFLVRTAYLGIAVYSVLCLMYSLSRGAYAAFLAGWVFLGLVKQRTLLVLLVIFAGIWASVVPFAVVERVEMTRTEDGQLDHSSEVRIRLWQDAMQLISANPILGTGFNTYAYMARVGDYRDTHNYYLKVLVETGVIGLLLFLLLLGKCFSFGWSLFRRARNPLFAGLGLGLLGWLVCAAVSNAFGDRWSYLQIQGFFWVLAGLVARGWVLDSEVAMEGSADGAESLEESTRTEDGLPVAVQVS
jgi:O-antigen ligase